MCHKVQLKDMDMLHATTGDWESAAPLNTDAALRQGGSARYGRRQCMNA